jgi:hypothetical protein
VIKRNYKNKIWKKMKNKSKTNGGGGYKQHLPNTKLFITELRKNLLDLTIEDFIFQMG